MTGNDLWAVNPALAMTGDDLQAVDPALAMTGGALQAVNGSTELFTNLSDESILSPINYQH